MQWENDLFLNLKPEFCINQQTSYETEVCHTSAKVKTNLLICHESISFIFFPYFKLRLVSVYWVSQKT